jgi:hypothetical protein
MGFTSTSPFGSTPSSPFASTSTQNNQGSQWSSTTPYFSPAASPFTSFISKLMTPQNTPGYNYLSSLLQNPGKVNPYVENSINAATNQASFNLPIEANRIRSQYYNGPTGRSLIGLDQVVNQSNLGLASLKAGLEQGQYNQDVQAALAAAGQLGSRQLGVGSLAAQLAALMRGSSTYGNSSSTGTASATPAPFDQSMLTQLYQGLAGAGNGYGSPTSGTGTAPQGGSMIDASNQNQALQAFVDALGGGGNQSFGG